VVLSESSSSGTSSSGSEGSVSSSNEGESESENESAQRSKQGHKRSLSKRQRLQRHQQQQQDGGGDNSNADDAAAEARLQIAVSDLELEESILSNELAAVRLMAVIGCVRWVWWGVVSVCLDDHCLSTIRNPKHASQQHQHSQKQVDASALSEDLAALRRLSALGAEAAALEEQQAAAVGERERLAQERHMRMVCCSCGCMLGAVCCCTAKARTSKSVQPGNNIHLSTAILSTSHPPPHHKP